MSSSVPDDAPKPRCCHLKKMPDFNGYGFNLHAEKGKAGQFIGKVDPGSPAEAAGLKEQDRIIEVNGTNIGNENHQQVVQRIKSVPDETRLLVVDAATDNYYKDKKIVIRGDMPNVSFKSNVETEEPPPPADSASNRSSQEIPANAPKPRLCHLRLWEDFQGYGFNLHAEKGKPGQFIGSVDPNSPAELAGLKEGDRIVEVNGENIGRDNHSMVVQKIKSDPKQTRLLVVDEEAETYYREKEITVSSSQSNVKVIACPETKPKENGAASQVEAEVNHVSETEQEDRAEEIAEYSTVNKSQPEPEDDQQTNQQPQTQAQVPSTTSDAEDAAEAISEMEKVVEDAVENQEQDEEKYEYNNNTDVAEDYDIIENVPKQEVLQRDPSPEPIRDPSPEPERAPTPEPVRAPTPEPARAPTPEPVRERDPSPEPPKQEEKPSEPEAKAPTSPKVTVGGIEWGSAAEARQKVSGKKRRDEVKSQNLSAKAKYELLMKM